MGAASPHVVQALPRPTGVFEGRGRLSSSSSVGFVAKGAAAIEASYVGLAGRKLRRFEHQRGQSEAILYFTVDQRHGGERGVFECFAPLRLGPAIDYAGCSKRKFTAQVFPPDTAPANYRGGDFQAPEVSK